MLIVGMGYGQLCNRLMLFSHFIANARENGYLVLNPGFDDYSEHFDEMDGRLFCRYDPAGQA